MDKKVETKVETKIEKIGNVQLDLAYYPGEDFYCDGTVEDELLDIVKNNSKEEFGRIIEEKKSWPVLYHLSPLRGNIVEWLPISKTDKVLEIGSGCGAITGTLASKCGELTCIDLSKKRSLINAYRNQTLDNVTIKVGNFQDIEPSLDTDYDYICLIGVFEYAAAYINSEKPYVEFLNIIKKHLKSGGKIAIAIENRFGLKYFAGCMEDHLGNLFSGIENYPSGGVVRTFTRPALETIMRECDLNSYSFYYPYPDYKFMHTLYSDDRLPNKGELTTNLRNFDRDRILLFDEKNAFDSIINDGQFPLFSNSYFVLIGDKCDITYSKYSNDRDKKYAIRTDCINENGTTSYRKVALNDDAKLHLDKIYEDGKLLTKRYEGSDLHICQAEFKEDGALYFEYLTGDTLENILDNLYENDRKNDINTLLEKYNLYLTYNENTEISDYDMIFPNILIDENNTWKLIDYEWSERKVILPENIFNRALYCYQLGSEKRKEFNAKEISETVCNSTYDEEKLNLNEIKFQANVTGNRKSLSTIRDDINYEVLPVANAIERVKNDEREMMVQVYPEDENGFSEATSYFIMPEKITENKNLIKIKLNNVKHIRIDFSMYKCMVCLHNTYVNQSENDKIIREEYPFKKITINGKSINNSSFVFNHNDPNAIFSWKKPVTGELFIEYEIIKLSDDMAESLSGK